MFKFRLWIEEQVSRTHHALFSCGGSAGRNKLGTKSSFKPTAVLLYVCGVPSICSTFVFRYFFAAQAVGQSLRPFFSALFPAKKKCRK